MRRTLYLAAASVALVQGGAGGASEGAAPAFVPMAELVVPIIDGSRAYGRLQVKLVLQAHDAAAIPSLQAQMPQLRETALIATAEFARMYASPFAPVDAERLAHDLSSALIAHDPAHAISKVLLVGVLAART